MSARSLFLLSQMGCLPQQLVELTLDVAIEQQRRQIATDLKRARILAASEAESEMPIPHIAPGDVEDAALFRTLGERVPVKRIDCGNPNAGMFAQVHAYPNGRWS